MIARYLLNGGHDSGWMDGHYRNIPEVRLEESLSNAFTGIQYLCLPFHCNCMNGPSVNK